ncbi:MAG: HD domain-containing protein [Lachnospiraceae bacterium]|nr:HD domain-containing protein [Lachnospiraceae bacterium]
MALLHDVGKIGISESIINKKGRLTDEEYEVIKQHPVLGAQILNSINEYPGLIRAAWIVRLQSNEKAAG